MCVCQLYSNWGNMQIISKINFAVKTYTMLAEHTFCKQKFSLVFWITNYFSVNASGDIAL